MPSESQKGRALQTRLRKAFGNEYVLLLIFSVLIGLAVSHGIVGFRKLIGLFQYAAFEVVIGQYTLSVFAPVVVASVVSAVVIRNYFGDYPAFVVPEYFIDSLFEVPMFMVLGLVCALVAAAFMYLVFAIQDGAAKLPMPVWMRPALGGLAIGTIAIAYPQVLGVGYPAMGLALKEALPLGLLFALMLAKMAATSIALGSGFAGGIFSPSLFIGAMTGGVFGLGVAQILPDFASTHGAYTVLGMASAVLGAPISTMLIIFELTNNTQMTIAVMVTVTTATVVAQQIVGHRSFFVWALERRGVKLADTSEQEIMLATTIENAVSDDFAVLPKSASIKETRELLANKRPGVVFVVDKQGRLEGGLTSAGFLERTHNTGTRRITAGDAARPYETVILPNASLDRALKLMAQGNADYLPVVDDIQARKVNGVIYLKDLMLARSSAADEDGT